jgi:hypothetical protein
MFTQSKQKPPNSEADPTSSNNINAALVGRYVNG